MNNDLWIKVDIMGLSKSVKRENQFSDACFQQIFLGFADFFSSFSLFHLLLTTHNPMVECCQGYDNHMIQQQNRIGQWVCSVICVGVCDCDESLLKLECLVLGNFLMRLSRIWEKIPEEKIKCCTMLHIVLLYLQCPISWGQSVLSIVLVKGRKKNGNHNEEFSNTLKRL